VEHRRRMERWDRALAQGIDSDHSCTAMFEELIVGSVSKFGNSRIEFGMGSREDMSSAANADCIRSLIAALSAQPEICGVESAGMPTTMNDYAQWITQSGTNNYRPFWDQGITGKNVIVQVSDSGLVCSIIIYPFVIRYMMFELKYSLSLIGYRSLSFL